MKALPFCLLAIVLASSASATVTETIRQTHPLAADGVVSLGDINGSIHITAWDRNEVSIEAVKKAPDADDLARIHVAIEARPERVIITTTHEKHGLFGRSARGEVDYVLHVPAGATLQKINSVNSGVTVTGVHGSVVVHTVNGPIRARALVGPADLRTVNGDVRAEFGRTPAAQRVSLESVNGDCALTLPATTGARIDARTVNGGLHSDLPMIIRNFGSRKLSGTIGDGGTEFVLRTVNGNITIRK